MLRNKLERTGLVRQQSTNARISSQDNAAPPLCCRTTLHSRPMAVPLLEFTLAGWVSHKCGRPALRLDTRTLSPTAALCPSLQGKRVGGLAFAGLGTLAVANAGGRRHGGAHEPGGEQHPIVHCLHHRTTHTPISIPPPVVAATGGDPAVSHGAGVFNDELPNYTFAGTTLSAQRNTCLSACALQRCNLTALNPRPAPP